MPCAAVCFIDDATVSARSLNLDQAKEDSAIAFITHDYNSGDLVKETVCRVEFAINIADSVSSNATCGRTSGKFGTTDVRLDNTVTDWFRIIGIPNDLDSDLYCRLGKGLA